MLLSEPLVSSIIFFRTSLIGFYLNNQRMSDSFYHITESSELSLKKKGLKHIHVAMFWNFWLDCGHDVNICTVQSMTS